MKNRLPDERKGLTHKVTISTTDVYITTGEYKDHKLGEVYITLSKEGNELRLMDAVAICISVALQHGVPLEAITSKLKYQRMGTAGVTDDPECRTVFSILDYLAKWLERKYPRGKRLEDKQSPSPLQSQPAEMLS